MTCVIYGQDMCVYFDQPYHQHWTLITFSFLMSMSCLWHASRARSLGGKARDQNWMIKSENGASFSNLRGHHRA